MAQSKQTKHTLWHTISHKNVGPFVVAGVFILTIMVWVVVSQVFIKADTTTTASFNAESGTVTGSATKVADATAADGQAVKFGVASGSPSGVAMPVGNITGWAQTFTEDFNGTSLDTSRGWGKYVADPIPSMPGGLWTADRVAVGNGVLTLTANDRGDGRWSSGGVANTGGGKRTYGKWLMRMRMDKSNGVKYAALLWPSGGSWPVDGEIDFAEDGGGNRTGTAATTHYAGTDGTGHYTVQRSTAVDMSQWQTVGVEWTPGNLKYTLNGQVWGTVTSPAAAIPDGPMFFAIQTEANTLGATQWMTTVDASSPRPTKLEVDWFVVYAQS
ncbi:MAG: glycoside hydrolase family 16 protein [Candidatus Saccharimonadales bacterium]